MPFFSHAESHHNRQLDDDQALIAMRETWRALTTSDFIDFSAAMQQVQTAIVNLKQEKPHSLP